MNHVEPGDWRARLAQAHAHGYTYLDFLTAIDRGDSIEVVAHLVNPDSGEHELFSTAVGSTSAANDGLDGAVLDSLAAVFRSADWHEREAAEMFGILFDGHPDPRPLLLRVPTSVPPLRKAFPLVERVETPWPGAAEAGGESGRSRRRQLAPGVLEEWREARP